MKIVLALLRAISWCLTRLPLRLTTLLGDIIGLGWFYLIPIRRSVVLENLTQCFGKELTASQIWKIARENYRHYGRSLIEIISSMTWTPEQFRSRVEIHGLEHAERYYKEGKGGYFLTCHLGNWEVLVRSGASWGIPVDIVVKYSKSQFFQTFLQQYRTRLNVGVLFESGTARAILRSVSSGRFVGLLIDQYMGPPVGIPVQFFGRDAGTAVGLALLTDKQNVPILPAYSYRDAKGRLHTVIEPAIEFPDFSGDKTKRLYEKTQFLNDIIEEKVRMHPQQWLWLHRRWKPFRGEPNWVLSSVRSVGVTILLAFALAGCASTAPSPDLVASPTGIELPPDPTIAVPEFGSVAENEDEGSVAPKEISQLPKSERRPTKTVLKGSAAKKKAESDAKAPAVAEAPKPKKVIPVVPIERIPFEIGEQLEIDLGWMALPAGTARIEVRKGKEAGPRPTLHLWGNVLSSKLVDTIYHVDNTIESHVDSAGLVPYKFLLHMAETAQNKETRVSFDHPNQKALYWAKRLSQKWGDDLQDRTDELVVGARDMFSALYYARTLNYSLNKKQSFFVYENGKNWEVELTPVANEVVISKAGAFQCWKILVAVKIANIFKPTGDIYMWLSDDSKRYLVKFDAKVKIGSLYGNLVRVRERL